MNGSISNSVTYRLLSSFKWWFILLNCCAYKERRRTIFSLHIVNTSSNVQMPAWFKGFSSSLSVESASLAWLPKTIFECNLNEIAEATSHICDAFHNLVPLVLFKKREKNSSMGIFHKLYQITQIAISWFGLFIIGPYKTNFLLI